MRIALRNINERISKIEAVRGDQGDPIRLIYSDGRQIETRETYPIRVEEVGACMGWYQFVEGYSNTAPDLIQVINLKTGEIWDFEKEARKPPLTDEEADEILREIMKGVNY